MHQIGSLNKFHSIYGEHNRRSHSSGKRSKQASVAKVDYRHEAEYLATKAATKFSMSLSRCGKREV